MQKLSKDIVNQLTVQGLDVLLKWTTYSDMNMSKVIQFFVAPDLLELIQWKKKLNTINCEHSFYSSSQSVCPPPDKISSEVCLLIGPIDQETSS